MEKSKPLFASKSFEILRNPSSWGNESEVNKRAQRSRNLGIMPFLEGEVGDSTGDAKDNNRRD